jgi:hypothetical protein
MKLEEGTVRSLVVPEGKRDIVVYDSVQAGLFLRKFASGTPSACSARRTTSPRYFERIEAKQQSYQSHVA